MPPVRIGIVSDFHCGHLVGLSPPSHWTPFSGNHKLDKIARVQREVWKNYVKWIEKYTPFDILLVNADCIEGKGFITGGTELLTSDRIVQCKLAVECIKQFKAPVIRMTYGSRYHVGSDEDYEDVIAKDVGASIGSHEWYEVNGVVIDMKHKIGSSSIPHGRATPLAREIMWNRLWSSRGLQPKADVIIRSHVHYYQRYDYDNCVAITTPALQGFGSKYGARECIGTVDIGLVVMDVGEKGEITIMPEILRGKTQVTKPERLG